MAIVEFKKAIEKDPNYGAPYTNLALIYEQRGEYKKALKLWRKRVEIGPGDSPYVKKAEEHIEKIEAKLSISGQGVPDVEGREENKIKKTKSQKGTKSATERNGASSSEETSSAKNKKGASQGSIWQRILRWIRSR